MFYPTYTWQELNWNPAYTHTDFFDFCSNVTNIDAPANVTAVDSALAKYSGGKPWINLGNYAEYVKRVIVPLCEDGDINSSHPGCFSTQNVTHWVQTAIDENRSYLYTSNLPLLPRTCRKQRTDNLDSLRRIRRLSGCATNWPIFDFQSCTG